MEERERERERERVRDTLFDGDSGALPRRHCVRPTDSEGRCDSTREERHSCSPRGFGTLGADVAAAEGGANSGSARRRAR